MRNAITTRTLWSLLGLLAAAGVVTETYAFRPAAAPVPDSFGYSVFDQTAPQCGFDWVGIETTGVAVVWTASGTEPAQDDGGAVIPLAAPFELYGVPTTTVVLSSNGYLGLAASLESEDGGDFSNDAGLPAIPDNASGVAARMLAYHDDLNGLDSSGSAFQQHFPVCPRPSEAFGAESCTVFQWTDWSAPGAGEAFELQIVAYHQSFELVFQIRPGPGGLSGGTIGIQNADATVASQYRPDSALAVESAICFFEPRYPPGGPVADLEIFKVDKLEGAVPVQSVGYAIGIANHGPSPVADAAVSDVVPATLVNCAWTCSASEGSFCAPSGSDGIAESVDIGPGGWVDYELLCEIGSTGQDILNTATAAVPAGITDSQPGNNSATDVLPTVAGGLGDGLQIGHAGSQLVLDWTGSCLASDVDFSVYEGPLGNFAGHVPIACSTAGATTLSHPLPAASTYYLVVPTNLTFEGSYGPATGSGERAPSPSACLPRSIAGCP